MSTKTLCHIALAGTFCLAVLGTITTFSDPDKATVITPPAKGMMTVSQKRPKQYQGKSDRF